MFDFISNSINLHTYIHVPQRQSFWYFTWWIKLTSDVLVEVTYRYQPKWALVFLNTCYFISIF